MFEAIDGLVVENVDGTKFEEWCRHALLLHVPWRFDDDVLVQLPPGTRTPISNEDVLTVILNLTLSVPLTRALRILHAS